MHPSKAIGYLLECDRISMYISRVAFVRDSGKKGGRGGKGGELVRARVFIFNLK